MQKNWYINYTGNERSNQAHCTTSLFAEYRQFISGSQHTYNSIYYFYNVVYDSMLFCLGLTLPSRSCCGWMTCCSPGLELFSGILRPRAPKARTHTHTHISVGHRLGYCLRLWSIDSQSSLSYMLLYLHVYKSVC